MSHFSSWQRLVAKLAAELVVGLAAELVAELAAVAVDWKLSL